MPYATNTIQENTAKVVYSSQKYHVEADSYGNHIVTRKSDAQDVRFIGDVCGNRVFKNSENDITDKAISFWATHDSWFM